jgi:hypothetical protein
MAEDDAELLSPCACASRVHEACLARWVLAKARVLGAAAAPLFVLSCPLTRVHAAPRAAAA